MGDVDGINEPETVSLEVVKPSVEKELNEVDVVGIVVVVKVGTKVVISTPVVVTKGSIYS